MVVESPIDDLDVDAGYWMLEALRRASVGRRLIASFGGWPATAAGHSLLHAMEKVAQLHDNLADEWTPDAAASGALRRYRLVLAEPVRVLVEELQRCGWSLVARPWVVFGAVPPVASPAALEWIAELPASESVGWHIERLQELARSVGTPILELVPLQGPPQAQEPG
jgi:hypothetical protein